MHRSSDSQCLSEGRATPNIAHSRGISTQCNTRFLGITRFSHQNGISIGSAVFAERICVTHHRQTDRQTDHATYDICSNRPRFPRIIGHMVCMFRLYTNNKTIQGAIDKNRKHRCAISHQNTSSALSLCRRTLPYRYPLHGLPRPRFAPFVSVKYAPLYAGFITDVLREDTKTT